MKLFDIVSIEQCNLTRICSKVDNCYGFINNENKVVIPCVYKTARDFYNNISVVGNGSYLQYNSVNIKFGIINTKGEMLCNYRYDIIYDNAIGVNIVIINDKFGIINNKGSLIIPCIYDDIKKHPYRDFFITRKNKKIYFIDNEGNIFNNEKEVETYIEFQKKLNKILNV